MSHEKDHREARHVRKTPKLVFLLLATTGVVAGALWFMRPLTTPVRVSEYPSSSEPSQEQDRDQGTQAVAKRLARLEYALGERAAKGAGDSPVNVTPPTYAELEDSHRGLLNQHSLEVWDPVWAPKMENLYKKDLAEAVATVGASLSQVSCRSSTCVATLDWPNRQAAVDGYHKILTYAYASPCGRQVLVPEKASDPTGKVAVTAIFDCSTWRSNGQDVPLPDGQLAKSL